MAKASQNVATIAELREERGWTIKRIAEHIGCSVSAVAWQCLINGIDKPGVQKMTARYPAVSKRGDHLIRRFTEEEDVRLVALEAQGLNCSQMARQLGRKPNTIRGRLATLARLEERGA